MPEIVDRLTVSAREADLRSVPILLETLRAEGIVTKIQHRTSGPHRGGIPFARGSLFYLLKNPVYRGKIVHKANVYDGEHGAIVDEHLWQAVQAQLKEKAPPRKRRNNDPQRALLGGLLLDPEGRQIVPTYATKGTRRYSYYETRKDLARPHDPPSTRFQRGNLDQHVIDHIARLLDDEHALRRMSALGEAEHLRRLFIAAQALKSRLMDLSGVHLAIHSFITLIKVDRGELRLRLDPKALGIDDQPSWIWNLPRPAKKPFREAKLRIDDDGERNMPDPQLITLLVDAFEMQKEVLAAPDLSLNQLASRLGRCRKQMTKLLRLSWLSPRLVEMIADGAQPKSLNRKRLLEANLPVDWYAQEALLGVGT